MSRTVSWSPGSSRRSNGATALVCIAAVALLAAACSAHLGPTPGAIGALATPSSTPAADPVPAASSGGLATPDASPPLPAPSSSAGPGATNLPAIPPGAVPILYYHRVEAPPPDYPNWSKARKAAFIAYDVVPAAFSAQLDWLVANGYKTILPRDLAAHWDSGTALPAKPVLLTFDDGSHDWVDLILPMLRARGMVAEFYLTLTAIGDGNISWAEVQALASAGQGIGAHDVHHVQLAELGAGRPDASPATMWAEVRGARDTIFQHLGAYPDSMAYVGGGFDATLEALVRQAGYTTARSIRRGIVQTAGLRFELHVVRIGPHDDVSDVVGGTIVPGLPVFSARMHGVSDQPPR